MSPNDKYNVSLRYCANNLRKGLTKTILSLYMTMRGIYFESTLLTQYKLSNQTIPAASKFLLIFIVCIFVIFMLWFYLIKNMKKIAQSKKMHV